MRVVIADPPAYTPPYDYALAAALARQGVDVRLLTSRFRFGAVPERRRLHGRRQPLPLSTRLGSSRAAARGEGARASARSRPARPRPTATCFTCSGSQRPRSTRWLLRTRAPLVFTAHDLLPRRTASHTRTWRRLFGRFDRVVTHSERGRDTLEAFGVDPRKLRVIPHPVFRSDPPRTTTAAPCSRSA